MRLGLMNLFETEVYPTRHLIAGTFVCRLKQSVTLFARGIGWLA
jgi:hypothetical protein